MSVMAVSLSVECLYIYTSTVPSRMLIDFTEYDLINSITYIIKQSPPGVSQKEKNNIFWEDMNHREFPDSLSYNTNTLYSTSTCVLCSVTDE